MPRSKAGNSGVDFRYVLLTYALGLYGGLVSGLIVSFATVAPSPIVLWIVGIVLVLLGLLGFVIIHNRLAKKN